MKGAEPPPSALTPIPNQTMSDLAYRALRSALMRREFQANEQLDLVDLGRRLGLSNTPLKQALRKLDNEGLVEIRPRSGTFVRPITEERLRATSEARLALERWGIAKFPIRDAVNLRKLEQLLTESEALAKGLDEDAVGVEDEFAMLDHDFHLQILRAAGNSEMVRLFELLGAHAALARAWCLETTQTLSRRVRNGVVEHRSVLEALRSGDRRLATSRLAEHVRQSTEGACQIVRAQGGEI